MSGTTAILDSSGESSGAMLALAQWQAAPPTRRFVATKQLMAPYCGVVLPRLDEIPVEHRFLADDREAIALAEILVKSDIAMVEDWGRSGRDATKYLSLTLQRWAGDHGGAAIERRFDLNITLSDRLVDYSNERGPEGTLYLMCPASAGNGESVRPLR